jgi:hypothetical protein
MIRFACACGRQLQADAKQIGSQAACPVCARFVTVPDESAGDRPAEPRFRPPATPRTESRPPVESPKIATDHPAVEKEVSAKAKFSFLFALALLAYTLTMLSLRTITAHAFASIFVTVLASSSMTEIHESRRRLGGMWMAVVGLVAGVICFAVSLLSLPFLKG